MEVARQALSGADTRSIAAELHMSAGTVRNHVSSIAAEPHIPAIAMRLPALPAIRVGHRKETLSDGAFTKLCFTRIRHCGASGRR
ncbi:MULTISPECIES: LuxR C-terminal-related transcriptional regulator [Corynebacterium]|uniref:LuxR C-terminal-related transcriptional regulator n=1 Tax=Corynebacterium TaxID=1716 RepID=UPI001CEFADDE|nr:MULTISPECIES: LuxR C-terminal-related transcriptional regulator [Corynebacterium]